MSKPLAVLIVEDSESDAQLMVRMLEKAGFTLTFEQVESAAQMRAALEKQTWEIVISDFSLPELDGFRALKVSARNGSGHPIHCRIRYYGRRDRGGHDESRCA